MLRTDAHRRRRAQWKANRLEEGCELRGLAARAHVRRHRAVHVRERRCVGLQADVRQVQRRRGGAQQLAFLVYFMTVRTRRARARAHAIEAAVWRALQPAPPLARARFERKTGLSDGYGRRRGDRRDMQSCGRVRWAPGRRRRSTPGGGG